MHGRGPRPRTGWHLDVGLQTANRLAPASSPITELSRELQGRLLFPGEPGRAASLGVSSHGGLVPAFVGPTRASVAQRDVIYATGEQARE